MLLYHILERLDLDAEKLRTKVLHYEIRIQEPADLAFETWNLHRLAQDMHVLTEYYADVEAKIQFLKQAYRAYRDSSWVRTRQAIMRQDLEHLEAMWWRTSVSKQWIVTYKDRVNILINHVFHISSQEQARATAAIAQDAAKDSLAMGTVAAVTLFFLPPTFVCVCLPLIHSGTLRLTIFSGHLRHGLFRRGRSNIGPENVVILVAVPCDCSPVDHCCYRDMDPLASVQA